MITYRCCRLLDNWVTRRSALENGVDVAEMTTLIEKENWTDVKFKIV